MLHLIVTQRVLRETSTQDRCCEPGVDAYRCWQVHAPLADPVPTPPRWAGKANYKNFRKRYTARRTSLVQYGEAESFCASNAEEHLQ